MKKTKKMMMMMMFYGHDDENVEDRDENDDDDDVYVRVDSTSSTCGPGCGHFTFPPFAVNDNNHHHIHHHHSSSHDLPVTAGDLICRSSSRSPPENVLSSTGEESMIYDDNSHLPRCHFPLWNTV